MSKKKQTPTTRTIKAINKLRTKLTFAEIRDRLHDNGVTVSIGHLSRICSQQDNREASEVLADAAEAIRREVFGK